MTNVYLTSNFGYPEILLRQIELNLKGSFCR